jgi:hypothetical protein
MLITKKKKKKKKERATIATTKIILKSSLAHIQILQGIRTSRDLDISVLNICDISVLGTGHLGTRYRTSRYPILDILVLGTE